MARFNATIEDVKAKTEAFQQGLENAGVTETAQDGLIAVTVAPNGSLTNLRIDESAWRGSGSELANKIMHLARKAQRAAAVNVAEAYAPMGGADSEALHMITGYIPEPEEDEEPEQPGYAFEAEPETPQPPPPPPANRVEPPPRPTRPSRGDDDEDFGQDDIFGR